MALITSLPLLLFLLLATTVVAEEEGASCAGGITQSRVIAPSLDGGLRRECNSRFLQADPMTGGILEMCGTVASALPTFRCGETRIGGIAVVGDHLYYTTGTSVRSLRLDAAVGGDSEVVGGLGKYRIVGEFFDGLVDVRLRGISVACSRTSTVLDCVATDPSLVGANALLVEPSQVVVQTELGGNGTLISRTLSELRRAEYKENAPPAVFEVQRVENYALRTVALCSYGLDDDDATLFVSSLGTPVDFVTGSPGGFGGILKLSLREEIVIEPFLRDAPRILGLACHSGRLYYSDAGRGCVVSRDVRAKGEPGDEFERILIPVVLEPRGLAVDPSGTGLYVSANSRILRASINDDQDTPSSEEVVLGPRTAAPDGVILLPRGGTQQSLDRDLRLVWVDANRPKMNAATRYGTRQVDLPKKNEKLLLRFPRALAEREGTFYVGEWLGRIWRLPSINSTTAELIRDDASTKTAAHIRDTLEREDIARLRLQQTSQGPSGTSRRTTYLVPS